MPFVSKKQERFAYANPEKFGGDEGLKEWSSDTDQESLPEAAPKRTKKFNYAPKARASYTKAQRVA